MTPRVQSFFDSRTAEKQNNPQLNATTTREQFVAFRASRDVELAAPKLLYQSVQVNIAAGRLPPPRHNGTRYLVVPINLSRRADELGRPWPRAEEGT